MRAVRRATLLLLITSAAWGGCRHASAPPPSFDRGDIELVADSELLPSRVAGGATFGGLLAESHLHPEDVAGILAALPGVFDPRQLRVDQPWRLERTHERGSLRIVAPIGGAAAPPAASAADLARWCRRRALACPEE